MADLVKKDYFKKNNKKTLEEQLGEIRNGDNEFELTEEIQNEIDQLQEELENGNVPLQEALENGNVPLQEALENETNEFMESFG